MNTDDSVHGDAAPYAYPDRMRSCLQEAYKEILQLPVIGVSASIMVGATLIYSLTGALGIDDTIGPVQRLLFGGLCAVICWPISHSMISTLLHFVRRMRTFQILTIWAASILFIAMPCAAVGYAIIGLFGLNDVPFPRTYLHFGVGLAACNAVLMYTACLNARLRHTAEAALSEVGTVPESSAEDFLDTSHRLVEPGTSGPGDPAATAADASSRASGDEDTGQEGPSVVSPGASEQPTRFLDRLPEKLGRDVIHLNVGGHYVNVATTEGSSVILMRFADAVTELGDMGMQVHRSYWVAHRHITGVFRRDERTMVRVTGGTELPVSRTYLAAVRARDSSAQQIVGATEGTELRT